jgi:hypothetical protein
MYTCICYLANSNEECARAICVSFPDHEPIITRVFRLLETATDDTTKNEAFRLIGHLIRYGWDQSTNADSEYSDMYTYLYH